MFIRHIPTNRLPLNSAARRAALRDYFCDKDAEARLEPEGWALRLGWAEDVDRYVDPRLDEGLDWWGGGITRPTMATAHRRTGRILTALYDTWTLFSWSQWLVARKAQMAESILILHVDDHRDLSAPRLYLEGEKWCDAITGAECSLDSPDSLAAAVGSGAIGMGSFLPPFLHKFPRTEIRHLCQPPKAKFTRDFHITHTTLVDDLLDPGRLRPAINLVESPGELGHGHYRLTPYVQDWLEGIFNGMIKRPILLHIDMDYFNNRFDGDTCWTGRQDLFDPSLDEIFDKIDELTSALQNSCIGPSIEDIVIAYSPGFFPAEFWAPTEVRLRSALEQLYVF